MRRGHAGILQVFELEAPRCIVAIQGWAIGGVVPAGAAVRHPHRRRGRPVHAARGRPRRDPRHRRRGPALPDVRSRRRQRPGAHRPADARPRRRSAMASCRGSCRPRTSIDTAMEMAAARSPRPRRSTVKMARRVLRSPVGGRRAHVDGRRADLPDLLQTSPTTWPSSKLPAPKAASPPTTEG